MAEGIPYEVVLHAIDQGNIGVDDFGNFLRDIVSLHDRLCLITSERHRNYDLGSSFFYTRYGRPVPAELSLQLTALKKGSPIEIGLLLVSISVFARAASPFVQALKDMVMLSGEYKEQQGRIRRQRLDEALVVQQIETARLDNMERRERIRKHLSDDPAIRQHLTERNQALLSRDIERIDEHPIVLTGVDVKRSVTQEQIDGGLPRNLS